MTSSKKLKMTKPTPYRVSRILPHPVTQMALGPDSPLIANQTMPWSLAASALTVKAFRSRRCCLCQSWRCRHWRRLRNLRQERTFSALPCNLKTLKLPLIIHPQIVIAFILMAIWAKYLRRILYFKRGWKGSRRRMVEAIPATAAKDMRKRMIPKI